MAPRRCWSRVERLVIKQGWWLASRKKVVGCASQARWVCSPEGGRRRQGQGTHIGGVLEGIMTDTDDFTLGNGA